MPLLRDTALYLMPKSWRDSAIADSKTWQTRCTTCNHESNVWDLGGMRWKAIGEPLTSFKCSVCGKVRMHKLSKTIVRSDRQV